MANRIVRTGVDLEHHIQGQCVKLLRQLPLRARQRVAMWLADAMAEDKVEATPDARQADLFG